MPEHKPTVLGITGIIGSGKSLVGRILVDAGVPVIDTDLVVHELLSGDTATRAAVVQRFGKDMQKADGAINRPQLARIVFADEQSRHDLEAIVHPAVRAECRRRVSTLANHDVVAVLVPLLFEAGISNEYDVIWTVCTDLDILRERLRKRDNLTDEQINARLNAQWSQERKVEEADTVIDNSSTVSDTTAAVLEALQGIKRPR